MHLKRIGRFCVRYWLGRVVSPGFLLVPAAVAVGVENPGDATYELPKYTVVTTADLPPPEAWRYAELPGFVVLSNASDLRTQQLLGDFELFRRAVSIVWPLPERTSVPLSIIVCGARDRFADFLPKEKRNGSTLSLLLHDRLHGALVIDAQTSVFVSPVATGDPYGDKHGFEVEPANLLYREYFRYLLSRAGQPMPIWMEEGLIQILLAMQVSREQIVVGRIEDPKLGPASDQPGAASGGGEATPAMDDVFKPPVEDRDFNYVFKERRLMPWEQFFAVTRDSSESGQIYGDNRWVKQAYAFVHMCLYGRGGRFKQPFSALVRRAATQPVTEAMFRECFGLDYRQMLIELQLYISFTDHQSTEYNFKKGKELPAPTPILLRDADEAESARIKGDALLLGGNLDLAEAALLPAYQRGSRDPALLATLGLYERAAGHDDRARKFLQTAVARQVVRPEAYLELARLRFKEAAARPGAGGKFSPAQVAGITRLLYVARHQPPHLPAVYGLLAETWRHSAEPAGREDVLVLIQGATLFADNLDLVHAAAVFAVEAGILEAARPMIEHGLSHATQREVRARFESLKKALPPN